MSKGLEALEHLYNEYILTEYPDSILEDIDKDKEIIEKELKRLEDIDSILNTGGGIWAENGIVSKKLKALEIIKPYIHIYCVAPNDRGGVRIWFTEDGKHYVDMPQEQFDLLKEVLL